MIFVDSGYLVALAERRDSLHQRALAYDEHFEQAGFEALLRRDPTP